MPRFFIPFSPAVGERVTLAGDDARHVASSLRMRPGEELTLCDCAGVDYVCTVVSVSPAVVLEVNSTAPSVGEPPYLATVYQAEVKGDRFDSVVQKAVELGASAVVPFVSSRCVARPDPRDAEKKRARREKIALEAAKQCGRGIVPTVGATVAFGEMLARAAEADLRLFCWEKATAPVRSAAKGTPRTVSIVIGPEGGFSEEEAEAAERSGLTPVSLGRRILRTETASGVVLAMLSFEFET